MLESADKGEGLYSFREAAFYLGVHPNTLRSWFFPGTGRQPLLDPKIVKTDEDGAWLGFHDFLQAFAVTRLKSEGLKPSEVREAIKVAKEEFGLPYPLSVRDHKIYVDDRHRVYIQAPGELHPSQLAGKGRGERSFREIVEPYLHLLEFDADGMVSRLIVFQELFGASTKRVTMEPGTNFGEPTVEGTGYRVLTLQRAVKAEGSVEDVARIYELEEAEVILALHAETAAEIKIAA